MTAWWSNTVKRWPSAAYCVLVYGLVWLLFLAFHGSAMPAVALLIGSWLPNLAGLLVTAVAEGGAGTRRLLARFALWRIDARWYAAALLLPGLSVLIAIGVYVLSGNHAPAAIPTAALLPAALFNLILGPLGEELGWRGTLLPRLRLRYGVLAAGLLVGLIWGPFHLPAWLMPGMPQTGAPILAFLLSTVAFSVFLAWLFERTGGSLLITCLAHWAINFAGSSSGIYGVPAILWLWAGAWWVIVATIVVYDRHHRTRHTAPSVRLFVTDSTD